MSKKMLYGVFATVFTMVATVVASSACWYYWYQPQEPKSLCDK